MKRLSDFAFAIVIYSVFVSTPAQAYLDSATVSMILQAVAGAFASFILFGKLYWARFVALFRRRAGASAAGDNREA